MIMKWSSAHDHFHGGWACRRRIRSTVIAGLGWPRTGFFPGTSKSQSRNHGIVIIFVIVGTMVISLHVAVRSVGVFAVDDNRGAFIIDIAVTVVAVVVVVVVFAGFIVGSIVFMTVLYTSVGRRRPVDT